MVLKLYGSAIATSRVLVTLLEKELPYEFILVDLAKGEQKGEEYKRLQPFGKVPVVDDDGLVLFESRAICKYLDKKYASGKRLMPEDDEAYGRFEQACSVEQSYFAAAAETIGTELIIKPMKGLGPPDEARVAQAEHDLDAVLSVYDEILAGQRYLVGDQFTLADFFHLPNGAALKAGKWKEVFEKYPNVDRWFKELQERESWVRAATEAGTVP
ncbi:Glutathione-S-transferase [Penicillium paradoxum]|uniref:Glutathione-S-transferase n=1 Tax=Penicillium paradoxum TaxID=176176 RepID=UPI002548965F|nr:Glutathione-S-transferase [Penicillium paradoxum]KAJ5780712.1 Glutathione-S-transferase [Penicillium paradoxum]